MKQEATQLRLLGEVLKTFGAQGQLLVKLKDDISEQTIKKEPVFISMDGLQVPFYVVSFSFKGTSKALVVFENMETEELAEELVGKSLHVASKNHRETVGEEDSNLEDLLGFIVVDVNAGDVGEIVEVMPIPNNPCLVVSHLGREVIIPIHQELIERISLSEKIIFLDLPQGLLELYD